MRDSERHAVLVALETAEKRAKPPLREMFDDVYSEKPPHILKQEKVGHRVRLGDSVGYTHYTRCWVETAEIVYITVINRLCRHSSRDLMFTDATSACLSRYMC